MKASFWCNIQKKAFMCFSTNMGRHLLKSNNVGPCFYPDFQGFCPDFQQIKTSTSNIPAFHNSVIGNFMVYQDQLETNLLQLFRHSENSEWFSIISVIIFEVNIVDEQKQTSLVTIFCKFPLPSTVLYPLPYRTVARKFSIGGLYVCLGGLDILKFDKNSTDL